MHHESQHINSIRHDMEMCFVIVKDPEYISWDLYSVAPIVVILIFVIVKYL